MQIIGYKHIPSHTFRHIKTPKEIEEILHSDSKIINDCVFWFRFNEDFSLLEYCKKQSLMFGVLVKNIKDFIICANFNPTYLLVEKKPKIYQHIADNYLLDSKVLFVGKNEGDIKKACVLGIDGVIFL